MAKERIISNESDRLKIEQLNDNYLVQFNGNTYKLNKTQYKAIMRKVNMPDNRLEVWLKSYSEENV